MSTSKKKIEIEYILFTSPSVLFNHLSTPSGLSEWFADDVNVQGQIYSFVWKGAEQKAEEVIRKENRLIRFHWIEEDPDVYFEFKINNDELTGDTALIITDFCEPGDEKDTIDLWNRQVEILKHGLGSH
jgi:uncharacterized protein YndB with AHSA1/START domain